MIFFGFFLGGEGGGVVCCRFFLSITKIKYCKIVVFLISQKFTSTKISNLHYILTIKTVMFKEIKIFQLS